ncbi:hypothetical protein FRB95_003220 [Tulasnella sp. JGI-2019a]|nr:hypothetical protein FRB95_003220 [Tulasnella sp. JGI-2019a]
MAKGEHGKPSKTDESEKILHSTALKIPEILKEVMLLSKRPEHAMSARECRTWSAIAIDVLWRDLNSVFPLLELIAPLEQGPENRLVFPNFIKPVEWERFHSYVRRVRSFAYNDTETHLTRNGYTGIISKTIFGDVYLINPTSGPLLPNASEVTWTANEATTAHLLLPFISSHTEGLSIELGPKCSAEAINNLLNHLRCRVSGVLDFKFFIHNQVDDVTESLATCLGQMKALQRVTLPMRFGASPR